MPASRVAPDPLNNTPLLPNSEGNPANGDLAQLSNNTVYPAQSACHKLPPETLITIFEALQLCQGPAQRSPPNCVSPGWVAVSWVCRSWRNTAHHTRGLWTTLYLCMRKSWLSHFMSLSDPLPLSVRCDDSERVHNVRLAIETMTFILDAAPERVQRLVFLAVVRIGAQGHDESSLFRMLATPMPNLQTLKISLPEDKSPRPIPLSWLTSLRRFEVDADALKLGETLTHLPPTLRSLVVTQGFLTDNKLSHHLNGFMSVLDRCKELEELRISSDYLQSVKIEGHISLPALRCLELRGSSADVFNFIDHMEAGPPPHLSQLVLFLDNSFFHDMANIKSNPVVYDALLPFITQTLHNNHGDPDLSLTIIEREKTRPVSAGFRVLLTSPYRSHHLLWPEQSCVLSLDISEPDPATQSPSPALHALQYRILGLVDLPHLYELALQGVTAYPTENWWQELIPARALRRLVLTGTDLSYLGFTWGLRDTAPERFLFPMLRDLSFCGVDFEYQVHGEPLHTVFERELAARVAAGAVPRKLDLTGCSFTEDMAQKWVDAVPKEMRLWDMDYLCDI